MKVQSLGREDPLKKEMQPTPVLLPEKSHGQRSLVGSSPQRGKRVRRDTVTKQQQQGLGAPQQCEESELILPTTPPLHERATLKGVFSK